ncbi:eukaryotic translation initiation factor 2-alpha kinase 3-like isoform X2 [Artemia franciscana]|uniref:Protein kinase domain-containing protein n=1 Tax=Artemia franciscana TaxID=6661 RepID=A0AA88KV66_ARTSF|nr:hypothetical protein QYM36_017934 [Artemia franciscana]
MNSKILQNAQPVIKRLERILEKMEERERKIEEISDFEERKEAGVLVQDNVREEIFREAERLDLNAKAVFDLICKFLSTKISTESTSEEYNSRFLNEFETLSRLGKGGFGVVFEARNKLDTVRYAVKRVSLSLSYFWFCAMSVSNT